MVRTPMAGRPPGVERHQSGVEESGRGQFSDPEPQDSAVVQATHYSEHDVYDYRVATHVRKNITLPRALDERLRAAARRRGTSQSRLISHLVETGLAAEAGEQDPLLAYLGLIDGPAHLSETVDKTVYAR